MRPKSTLTNIDLTDLANYPDGRIRNNTGPGIGTPVNERVYGDIHEFFAKLMRLAGLTYNELPENETNGYQLIDAARALAAKNDFILTLTDNGNDINIPTALGIVTPNEFFICRASFDKAAHDTIIGTDTVSKSVVFTGDFLNNEYVLVINTDTNVQLIRLINAGNLDAAVAAINFLKAATQNQENTGTANNVATTPQTNLAAFTRRVTGADSNNHLASASNNGLMSSAQFTQLANSVNREVNYGTVTGDLPLGGGAVNTTFPVTGDITRAEVTAIGNNGSTITLTFANAMSNTGYYLEIFVESLGQDFLDNAIQPIVFKPLTTTTASIRIDETASVTHNLRLHITTIQR